MKVGDALVRYYETHGLPPDGGEQNAWFNVRIGSLTIPLPNPPARRRAVFLHDVNHLVTGYNTVFSDGEVVIAGFEVGAGCGHVWIAWFINLYMMAFGLVLQPRGVFRAFVRGRRSGSIYRHREPRADIREKTVAEMQKLLMLDATAPRASVADRFQFVLWSAIAVALAVGLPLAVVTAIWAIFAA